MRFKFYRSSIHTLIRASSVPLERALLGNNGEEFQRAESLYHTNTHIVHFISPTSGRYVAFTPKSLAELDVWVG